MNRVAKKRFNLWAWRHFVDFEFAHPRLTYLFWEATLDCNMACRHCGSDCRRSTDISTELKADEVLRVFSEIARTHNPRRVFVAVTGGEPLVRPDLFDVMAQVRRMGYPWGMVSNGWAVDDRVVDQARRSGMRTLVISLDGVNAESHDWLRGRGSFDRAVDAIGRFRRAGFLRNLQVTSTFHRRNIDELEPMYRLMIDLGIADWRVVSVFPNGRAARQADFLLEPSELRKMMDFIAEKRSRPRPIKVSYGDEGYLGCQYERDVRDFFYACFSGVRIASILADGGVTGCPNNPRTLVQGNVRNRSFMDIWTNEFGKFRDRRWMRQGDCARCRDFAICKGNSMHLWDTEKSGPKVCHVRMLKDAGARV